MSLLQRPLALPCGVTLSNRLAKAAMTEGLADPLLRATPRLESLYRAWSRSGAGLLITGNVMVDRRVLERPANVAIDDTDPDTFSAEARTRLRRWAAAATEGGSQVWMQLSHAGRQSPRYVTWRPLAPSAVQLDLFGNYGRPRELTEAEILAIIRRFAFAATVARETGFGGVEVHGAHGYLISSFLSPVSNRRSDAWGGSLENRARLLLETVRAVRAAVGRDFPVAVKLNSDDFRKGGFSHEESLQVARMLDAEAVDLLEVSGGTYEQPRLLGLGGSVETEVPMRESTRQREGYFLAYAEGIRAVVRMPLMVTGGFRTRGGMEAALAANACDAIGVARPLCTHPQAVAELLQAGTQLPSLERLLVLSPTGKLSPTSPILLARIANLLGAQSWYYRQIYRLADGRPASEPRFLLASLAMYFRDEWLAAARMHLARRRRARAQGL